MKEKSIEFYEVQRFRQWWIWLILIGTNAIFLWGCIQQLLLKEPWGDKPAGDIELILITTFVLLLTVAMFVTKLHTYINNEGVYVKLFPFHFRYKFFNWYDIQYLSVVKYNPLKSGGWGLKVSMDGAKYYSMSGNKGLRLILYNGKKIVIGTNQPDQMTDTLIQLDKMKT